MNFQTLKLMRMLCDPRITRVPLRVMRQLAAQGHRRAPGKRVNSLKFIREWLAGEKLTRHNGQWVLNSFLPPFPGRAYERMFENMLSGRRLSPVSAYLAVTSACPFNCKHCSLKQRPGGNPAPEQWFKAVQQLHELGCSLIGFTGGEPLLFPRLPELVKSAVDGGAETVVFSSGAGFTPELADRLKAAGQWAFCVSFDTLSAKDAAELRGRDDALQVALDAIKLSVEKGFYTMTGTLASPEIVSTGHYRELYAEACRLGVHEFRLIEPMPCGNYFNAAADCFLKPEQIAELREFHCAMNRRRGRTKVCAFNQVESPEFFGCGGGTQHMFIDPAGEVCPCDFTPLSFGNITTAPLAEIWRRMNDAMVNPRRHCFVQKNSELLRKFFAEKPGLPFNPETSEAICREAGPELFPDYFQMTTGREK